MARPGRKPTPNHIKKLRGGDPRNINENAPEFESEAPDPPEWLPKEARQMWEHIAPQLEEKGLLAAVDAAAFELALTHYAFAVEAAKKLKEEGVVVDGARAEKKNPAHQILRDNSNAFRQYLAGFGLSPSSRSRLEVDVEAPGLSTEDLLEAASGGE